MVLSNIFTETPINRKEISQELLDIENKQRTNPLPWKGQFSPQFIETLINKYANQNSVIFDPFLGSGTVLYEAGRFGMEAYGTEINPAALILANIYKFINLLPRQRENYINCFLNRLKTEMLETLPLFQTIQKDVTRNDLTDKIVNLAVDGEQEFINILHEALVILLDLDKKEVTYSRVFTLAENIAAFVLKLPYSEKPINAYNADARNIPLKNSSVNLVITSPPYINVFNYHQQYRASTEALNWKLLEVAKSEFGSNRKHRSNRFLTVIQYCLDIAYALQELLRICSYDSRIIFVVGRESNIRGTPFFNGELVAEVASQVLGISLDIRQERSFVNRYGKTIKEDILHFVKLENQPYYFALHQARTLAVQALESAYFIADEEVNLKLKMLLIRLKKYNLHLVLIGIILGNSLKKSTKKQNFMFNLAQPHGEKLAALLNNDKLPTTEKLRVGAGSPKISDSNQQSHKPAPSTRQNCHCFQNCHCEERSNLSLGDCFVPLFGQIILLNA